MIVVNCIGHSGFTVESETHMLLFDYWKGSLPRLPMKKKLYVFISHSHEDHFNPYVFSLWREHPDVHYVLSNDIPLGEARNRGVTECLVVEPGVDVNLGSRMRIKALPSTDLGVAFLVGLNGRNIFHAGDLTLWLWDDMDERAVYDMTLRFEEFTRPLRNFNIDTAFLPMDTRLGIYATLGLDYYMKHYRIRHAIPMHLNGPSTAVDDLLYDPASREYRDRIIKMDAGTKVSLP
ncbi:MAG: MBL fold metallo-hydrolase [Clostridia bacterium]|nr:MBL fold metallo-hydrolase [Clostridia bacterium]MBQ3956011.1 MBL fold metallo-hydrolase [Clostridia bacterium]